MYDHSFIYALIEIGDAEGTSAGLKNVPVVRAAALIALDQIGTKLDPKELFGDLVTDSNSLKQTAWWIAGRHPEWGGEFKDFLRKRMTDPNLSVAERNELAKHLGKFAKSPAIQELLNDGLKNPQAQSVSLQAMRQASLKQSPTPWLNGLAEALNRNDAKVTSEVLPTLRALTVPKQAPGTLTAALLKVAKDAKNPPADRLQALALIPGKISLDDTLFELARGQLDREKQPATRALAAEVLSHSNINSAQALALASAVKNVGPMEINRVLEALPISKDEKVGQVLLESLSASPAKSAVQVDLLKKRIEFYNKDVRDLFDPFFAALNKDGAKQQEKLEEMVKTLKPGDIRRGMVVFNSARAACSTCHAIGYVGGTLGPDLTRIGKIRTDRDLLEAIVFPSASFVRGYEPVVVTTTDGKTHNGILKKDAPDEVVLALAAHQEVRIARTDIETMQPSQVSVMPSGLDQQLTVQELADLVAFLKGNK